MAGLNLNPGESKIWNVVQVVRQLIEGKSNAVGTVTLTPNATSTAVAAPTAAPGSIVNLTPQTAHAAAAVPVTYILASNVTQGQFIISHANIPSADRTFGWEVRG